jgi:hypothetical protein
MDVALLLGQIKAPSQLPGTIVQAQFKYFKSRNKGSISARGKRIGVSAMGRIGVLRRDCYRARVRGHGRARSAGWEKQSRTTTRTITRTHDRVTIRKIEHENDNEHDLGEAEPLSASN